jgi:DNA-binding CsgD family transcriptional regulator
VGADAKLVKAVSGLATVVVDVVSRGEDPGSVLRPLQALVPFDAAMISIRDPLTGAHRPVAVAGYDPEMVRYLNSGFLRCKGYERARATCRALRVRDMPEFRGTMTYRAYLEPRGFREGVALMLRSGGSEKPLTGMLSMSFAGTNGPDDRIRDAIEMIAPVLGRLTDVRLAPALLRKLLAPHSTAVIVDLHGSTTAISTDAAGGALPVPPTVLAIARDFLRGRRGSRQGYLEDGRRWVRVKMVRLPSSSLESESRALVMLEPGALPHGLTPRELDVLSLVAGGMRNREIGEQLFTSPRTVGSHIEHILLKTGLSTRAALAAEAIDQGIVRLIGESVVGNSGEAR